MHMRISSQHSGPHLSTISLRVVQHAQQSAGKLLSSVKATCCHVDESVVRSTHAEVRCLQQRAWDVYQAPSGPTGSGCSSPLAVDSIGHFQSRGRQFAHTGHSPMYSPCDSLPAWLALDQHPWASARVPLAKSLGCKAMMTRLRSPGQRLLQAETQQAAVAPPPRHASGITSAHQCVQRCLLIGAEMACRRVASTAWAA